ncbi:uncharacterized protein KIAA1671-like isoform X2 [Anguilla anguilla]|uniref:uncharacterized protein KIAA1671-like isoform X2 n=1 Tax=Anguilla anguilla TaxID=7936 RepID=UPI0015AF18A9|nr:uncharacterized protein KIAA1671-like isoform X2 [Anguilla anguilla]
MERQLLELEKQRRAEREGKEREQERVRQLLQQQEMERQRAVERERETMRREEVMSSLRPGVLDLDSVSLADRHFKVSQGSDPGSVRSKLPSPRAEDAYRPGILDIDSFRSQPRPSPPGPAFPAAGIQGQPRTPEAPERPFGRPGPVWSASQLEFWEHRGGDAPPAPGGWAAPEPPQKPAGKPILEQLLLAHEERLAAPSLVPERRWSGLPVDSAAWAPSPGRETVGAAAPQSNRHGYADLAFLESPWLPREPVAPVPLVQRGESVALRGQQSLQAKDLTRARSRSVSRRSAPAESPLEGPLSRMRSRSAHREKDLRSWLKRCAGAEEEGRDTDTLVQETDSQYGTWDTGLRTDDSLTPATPSSDSNLSSSPRKQTPPLTPGGPATPSDVDTPDGLSPAPLPGAEPLPFPETSTTLLDSSALRSRVQLAKRRSKRLLPSRAARQSAALSVLQEGQGGAGDDWHFRDSTEERAESSKQEDSDPEEQARGAELRPPASQPQRVALFPGMDPSALKAQLKKRGDSDNQVDGASSSASQLSRSPKSPFLPRASRVLPPAGGKENGEESSPQWLRELKSKKRLSQYENDA